MIPWPMNFVYKRPDGFSSYFGYRSIGLPEAVTQSLDVSPRSIVLKRTYEIVVEPYYDFAAWWETPDGPAIHSVYHLFGDGRGHVLYSGRLAPDYFESVFAALIDNGVRDIPRLLPTQSTANQVDAVRLTTPEFSAEFLIRGTYTPHENAAAIFHYLLETSGIQEKFERRR